MSDQQPIEITVVIPVYNERGTLEPLVEGIISGIQAIDRRRGEYVHRILFVDDGSVDGSYECLCALRERFDTVDIIRFRRNFGKSAALAAGFDRATGDLVFTMDADLQDEPKEIPRFIEKLDEGYDAVVGWKAVRHDPWHKTIPSKFYNTIVSRVTGLDLHDVNCGYKLFRRDVVKKVRLYGEMHRLIPVYAANLGYRIGEISVEHHPRTYGVSKYGFKRFSRGALDLLTASFLTHHFYTPGHFFGRVGSAMGLIGLACITTGSMGLFFATSLAQATVATIGAILLVGGAQCVGLGLCAELALRHRVDPVPSAFIAEERIGPRGNTT